MKVIGSEATAILKMHIIAKSDEEKTKMAEEGQLEPKIIDASPLKEKGGLKQNRYTLTIGVSPDLEYEITGIMQTLENIGDAADYHVVEWNSAQIFLATVLRIASSRALADYADGDSGKLLSSQQEELSKAVKKVPEIWAMQQFYDTCFSDPDHDYSDYTFAISLKAIEE
ncbi:MAG: hypothetical protein ACI39G_01330 [Pseudoramibacter sp.]